MKEAWKKVKNYPNYEVSNHGSVRRIKNLGRWGKFKCGGLLKLSLSNCGYYKVSLHGNKKQKTFYVHRLVLENFIDGCFNKGECNHKNGIKTDNRLENLEWVTTSGNLLHAHKTGLANGPRGEKHGQAKLSIGDVLAIKKLYRLGNLQRDIANSFSVTRECISGIITGRNWKHLVERTP